MQCFRFITGVNFHFLFTVDVLSTCCSTSDSGSTSCFHSMSFKRALKVLFCGLLRFFRTLTAFGWRVLSKLRLRYTRQINMSDDECEFDSTWEDEDERTPKRKVFHRSRRSMFAAKDMQNFRHSCRGLDDDNISDDDDDGADEQDIGRFYNLRFYQGKLRSSPDNLYISDFHKNWWGDYDSLEDVHSYIQWLFPIQEPGVNWRAHVLLKKEIKLFRKDKKAKGKLVESYKLMLDFYGMRLVNESTGEVARAHNWEDRFRNLNRYTHNNLRITRILKCLGTLGFKHYQAPLVKFFLYETLVMGQLQNVKQSALDYFMFTVLDKTERRELVKYAFKHFKPQKHFVWGPRKILSGQVHYKKENIDQPTEKKQSSIAEEQHNNLHENKHKMNELEASHPPKEMQSKKDEPVIPNKLTETNSDQGANKSSQCSSENEDVAKNGDSDGNENIALANKSHGHDAVSGSQQTEEKRKKDHQNKDKPVIPNKLTETNSDQSSQCISNNEGVEKQNHEMSVGDSFSVSDDNEKIASANKSHGHDAASGSHQFEEGCSYQGLEVEMKDDTEHKESEDKQKTLNPNESKHEIEKTEPGIGGEMESKKDHQNRDEPVIPNKLSDTNSDQQPTESSQRSSQNKVVEGENCEISGDDNENSTPANNSHGHDAASGSHQFEEGCSYQGLEIEMKDDTEHKESEDKQKTLNLNESKHEIEKIEAGMGGEMESKKDHQNKDEPVIPNELSDTNSDQQPTESSQRSSQNKVAEREDYEMSVDDDDGVSNNNEDTTPANKSHGHDTASDSLQTEEGSSCQEGHDEEMDENENNHEQSDDEL